MTDLTPKPAEKLSKNNGKPFAKGYDKRRWLAGRPKIPKDKAEADKILTAVIWEELSRVINNPETGEDNDALRLMVRSMIRKHQTQNAILDRIAGKVQQTVDVTSAGQAITEIRIDDERFNRAISSLADAVRESVSGKSPEENGEMDTAK